MKIFGNSKLGLNRIKYYKPIEFVQAPTPISTSAGQSSYALSFVSNVTAGNSILAFATYQSDSDPLSCTDTLGNSYTYVGRGYGEGQSLVAFYTTDILGGANTVTITRSSSVNWWSIAIIEYKNIKKINPINSFSSNSVVGTAPTTKDGLSAGRIDGAINGLMVSAIIDSTANNNVYSAGNLFDLRVSHVGTISTAIEDSRIHGNFIPTWTQSQVRGYVAVALALRTEGI